MRDGGTVLSEHEKMLHYYNERAVLRSEQERHLLREHGVRAENGLLQGCLLRARPELRERPLFGDQRRGITCGHRAAHTGNGAHR